MNKSIERFLKYVSFDTQSDEESTTFPSTLKQLELAKYLYNELLSLGVKDVILSEYGYVYAKIPSNCGSNNTLGLIAHMDTSPDASGKDVKPRIVTFNGEDIEIAKGFTLLKEELQGKEGHQLIITDGTTLLGADDKAGLAIIMAIVEFVMNSQESHPNIAICFTPDEEVGQGTDHFEKELYFNPEQLYFNYTIDGGNISEMSYETFNAASAKIIIHGKSIHPGSAKDKMINSQLLALEFISHLPENERPEHTEKYEGFYHLTSLCGDVTLTTVSYIIRDHDFELFTQRKNKMIEIGQLINQKYGEGTIEVILEDSYYNMKEMVLLRQDMIDLVLDSMKQVGVKPLIEPIRGGTDGARLSFDGLPCPNLGTGGENFHGPLEYLDIDDFMKMIDIIKIMTKKLI